MLHDFVFLDMVVRQTLSYVSHVIQDAMDVTLVAMTLFKIAPIVEPTLKYKTLLSPIGIAWLNNRRNLAAIRLI